MGCTVKRSIDVVIACLDKQIEVLEEEERDDMAEGMLEMAHFARGLILTAQEAWKGECEGKRNT